MKQNIDLPFNFTKPLTSEQIEFLKEMTKDATGILLCVKGPTSQIKATYIHGVDLLDIAGFFLAIIEDQPDLADIMMARLAEHILNPDSMIVTEWKKDER